MEKDCYKTFDFRLRYTSLRQDKINQNQAVIFPADTRTLSAGNIEISQEIKTKQGIRRTILYIFSHSYYQFLLFKVLKPEYNHYFVNFICVKCTKWSSISQEICLCHRPSAGSQEKNDALAYNDIMAVSGPRYFKYCHRVSLG